MKKSTKIVAALGIAAGIGIAALPLGTFALNPDATSPATKDVEVELTISSGVGIASSKDKCTAEMLPNATTTCAHTVTIASNTGSAKLEVASKEGDSNLTKDASNYIESAAGEVAAGTSKWNITATGGTVSSAVTNAVVPGATDTALLLHSGAFTGDKVVDITYNFGTSASQVAGVYSDILTYTVTAL